MRQSEIKEITKIQECEVPTCDKEDRIVYKCKECKTCACTNHKDKVKTDIYAYNNMKIICTHQWKRVIHLVGIQSVTDPESGPVDWHDVLCELQEEEVMIVDDEDKDRQQYYLYTFEYHDISEGTIQEKEYICKRCIFTYNQVIDTPPEDYSCP